MLAPWATHALCCIGICAALATVFALHGREGLPNLTAHLDRTLTAPRPIRGCENRPVREPEPLKQPVATWQNSSATSEVARALGGPLEPSEACRANASHLEAWCNSMKVTCQGETLSPPAPLNSSGPPCRTLWFAGFQTGENSKCKGKGGGYRNEYAVALRTVQLNAGGLIQPVLVLLWEGTGNDSDRAQATEWAESRGVVVVSMSRLSFQDALNKNDKTGGIAGAFIRLDLPAVIEQHGLFNLPGVCQPSILYTDSDVVFTNQITAADVRALTASVERSDRAIVAYGPEATKAADRSTNTGVMVMNVPRFRQEWPAILKFGLQADTFPGQDQEWLNNYFSQPGRGDLVARLPLAWNWKAYWPLDGSEWSHVKIVHLHGPKPARGLWRMADCDVDLEQVQAPYRPLLTRGICCNRGAVANGIRTVYSALKGVIPCA